MDEAVRVGLKFNMIGVLIKRGSLDADRHAGREDDMKPQGEHHRQAKGFPRYRKLGERRGTDLPSQP